MQFQLLAWIMVRADQPHNSAHVEAYGVLGLCSAISEDSVSTQSIDKSHVLSPSITITDAVISGLSELNVIDKMSLHNATNSPSSNLNM